MKKKKFENLKLLNKKIVNKVEKKRKLSSLLNDSQMSNEEGNLSEVKEEDERRAEEVSSDEGQAAKESAKVEVNQALDPDEKRAIGYQISKNKGLIPSRKKEQRNPRVKYRNKYKTKLKKRKGQVREVRKELKRYDGEVSGIKSHTIKSVKFK
nr:something about silencing protein 10-like [Cherax quadricarinatus]